MKNIVLLMVLMVSSFGLNAVKPVKVGPNFQPINRRVPQQGALTVPAGNVTLMTEGSIIPQGITCTLVRVNTKPAPSMYIQCSNGKKFTPQNLEVVQGSPTGTPPHLAYPGRYIGSFIQETAQPGKMGSGKRVIFLTK